MADLCVPEPTTLRLVIEDQRLPATLEIRTKALSLGEWLEVSRSEETMVDGFTAALVSWNLGQTTKAGKPTKVPATRAGFMAQEPWLVRKVLTAWRRGVIGLPDPLEPSSNGGERSLEASLPMEPLSESPES